MKRKKQSQPDLTTPDLTNVVPETQEINTRTISVIAYSPLVRPLGQSSGGGFRLSLDMSDTEWQAVKDINGAEWQNVPLTVIIRPLVP